MEESCHFTCPEAIFEVVWRYTYTRNYREKNESKKHLPAPLFVTWATRKAIQVKRSTIIFNKFTLSQRIITYILIVFSLTNLFLLCNTISQSYFFKKIEFKRFLSLISMANSMVKFRKVSTERYSSEQKQVL